MSEKMKLEKTQVDGREGYVRSDFLVFATPLTGVEKWKAKMRKAGYVFGDDAEVES